MSGDHNMYQKPSIKVDGVDLVAEVEMLKRLLLQAQKKEWQGLTDEEIRQLEIMEDEEEERKGWCDPKLLIAWTEAKLKEKNG